MMDVIGKWKVVESAQFNVGKRQMDWVKVEDIIAKGDVDREMIMMYNALMVFEEGGCIYKYC